MVSSRDVARLAKVSQSTVSRAYREDVYIDPNTRKRVFEAAKQLGYYPNFSARSLRNQQSRIIGLMLSDPNNGFFASLSQHIEKRVAQEGYRLLLAYNEENAEKERNSLESLISTRAEGVLTIPVSRRNEDMYQIMRSNRIGTVQLLRPVYDNMNTVMVNDELGAYIATKYLLEQGHRRMGIFPAILKKNARIVSDKKEEGKLCQQPSPSNKLLGLEIGLSSWTRLKHPHFRLSWTRSGGGSLLGLASYSY